MKNNILILLIACCYFLSPSMGQAQNYIQLTDASGVEISQSKLALIQNATDSLLASFPEEYRDSFNVYDFGFYYQNELMHDSLPMVWENMITELKSNASAPYYLLFGKQSDASGIYSKFWLDLHLPASGDFACLDLVNPNYRNQLTESIKSEVEIAYFEKEEEYSQYFFAEIQAIDKLTKKLSALFDCCEPGFSGEACEFCPQEAETLLKKMIDDGFILQAIEIIPGTASTQETFGEPDNKEGDTKSLNGQLVINIEDEEYSLEELTLNLTGAYEAFSAEIGEIISFKVSHYNYPLDCSIVEFDSILIDFNKHTEDLGIFVSIIDLGPHLPGDIYNKAVLGIKINSNGDFKENQVLKDDFSSSYANDILDSLLEESSINYEDLVYKTLIRHQFENNLEEIVSLDEFSNLKSISNYYEKSISDIEETQEMAELNQMMEEGLENLENHFEFDKSGKIKRFVLNIFNAYKRTFIGMKYRLKKNFLAVSLLKSYKCAEWSDNSTSKFIYYKGYNAATAIATDGYFDDLSILNLKCENSRTQYDLSIGEITVFDEQNNLILTLPNGEEYESSNTNFLYYARFISLLNEHVDFTFSTSTDRDAFVEIFNSSSNISDIAIVPIPQLSSLLESCFYNNCPKIWEISALLKTASDCIIQKIPVPKKIAIIDGLFADGNNSLSIREQIVLARLLKEDDGSCLLLNEMQEKISSAHILDNMKNDAAISTMIRNLSKTTSNCPEIRDSSVMTIVVETSTVFEDLFKYNFDTKYNLNGNQLDFEYTLKGPLLDIHSYIKFPSKTIENVRAFNEPINIINKDYSSEASISINQVPAIVAPVFLKQNMSEYYTQVGLITLDAVSLLFGIAEIKIGFQLVKTGLSESAKKMLLRGGARMSLGFAEVGSTVFNTYCNSHPEDNVCIEYQVYNQYLQFGLIGVSAVDLLSGFATNAYRTALVAKYMDDVEYEKIAEFLAKPSSKKIPDEILVKLDDLTETGPDILKAFNTDLKNAAFFDKLVAEPQLVKAWEPLFVRNVPDALRKNTKFLERLTDNPNLINYVDNLTPVGRTNLANNVEIWIKRYDARVPLKNGNYDEAVDILGGTSGTPEVYNGSNYVGKLHTPNSVPPHIDYSLATPGSLQAIVNSTTDVSAIANKLGVSENVVQGAKQHLFVTEHLVETAPGVFTKGRFNTYHHNTEWWNSAASGNISNADADALRKLIGHEYIESKLMMEGLGYRPFLEPKSYRYGAHWLSVSDADGGFAHWGNLLDRNTPAFTLNPNLTNIDDVVNEIKLVEGLN